MLTKHLSKLALVCLLFPLTLFAQSNFKEGYIVNLKGDTIKGTVNYREWTANPSTIEFKQNGSTEAGDFNLENIKAFGVTNRESYVRFTVAISLNRLSINDPLFADDTVKSNRTVFLKKLIAGDKLTLFSYTDDVKTRFLVAEGKSLPFELRYSIYTGENAEVDFNRRYRTQLAYWAQKYRPEDKGLIRSILRADYEEDGIADIVKKINAKTYSQQTSNGNAGYALFIGGGVSLGDVSFKGTAGDFATHPTKSKKEIAPSINFGITYYTNRYTRRLFITADATLFTDHQNFSTTFATSSFYSKSTMLDYRQYTLSISPQVGYNVYNSQALAIFFSVGPGLNASVYNDYKYTENYSDESDPRVSKYPDFEHFWITPLTFRVGATVNQRVDVFASAGLKCDITNYSLFAASQSNYMLGIHYHLGKAQR